MSGGGGGSVSASLRPDLQAEGALGGTPRWDGDPESLLEVDVAVQLGESLPAAAPPTGRGLQAAGGCGIGQGSERLTLRQGGRCAQHTLL